MIYIGEKKEKNGRWDTHWGAEKKRIRRIILGGRARIGVGSKGEEER